MALTQAKRMQAYMAAAMYEVMELLEWDLMVYTMFKYECGLIYLETVLKGDAGAIRQLEESAAYWGWWKLHWWQREKDFLQACEKQHKKSMLNGLHGRRQIYNIAHHPVDLAQCVNKYGVALEESWCRQLVKELR